MSLESKKIVRFGVAVTLIVLALGYLAYTGVQESKSYYVKIDQLRALGAGAYTKTLRVEGIVQPGSIKRKGSQADFVIQDSEGGSVLLPVSYKGSVPPPDTFKDHAQALVLGRLDRDGTFQATDVQAKCASKYESMEKAQAEQNSSGSATSKN
jgi:cytochrome c-type biogenesis protein CcmE